MIHNNNRSSVPSLSRAFLLTSVSAVLVPPSFHAMVLSLSGTQVVVVASTLLLYVPRTLGQHLYSQYLLQVLDLVVSYTKVADLDRASKKDRAAAAHFHEAAKVAAQLGQRREEYSGALEQKAGIYRQNTLSPFVPLNERPSKRPLVLLTLIMFVDSSSCL